MSFEIDPMSGVMRITFGPGVEATREESDKALRAEAAGLIIEGEKVVEEEQEEEKKEEPPVEQEKEETTALSGESVTDATMPPMEEEPKVKGIPGSAWRILLDEVVE